jgi:hypothetical protein
MADTPGPGVDIEGRPVVDPTQNVKDLMDAAVKRLDDMLEAAVRRLDDLRYEEGRHTEAAVKRLDDLLDMETRHQDRVRLLMMEHVKATADLRGEFGEKLRDAESKRIDAIRAVDVGAVQRAAEVSAAQAQTLANQVAVSAEALRAQVAAAQSAAATSLAAALDPIQKDIADLRRAQYEAQGQKINVTEARGSNAAVMAAIGLAATVIIVLIAVVSLVLSAP